MLKNKFYGGRKRTDGIFREVDGDQSLFKGKEAASAKGSREDKFKMRLGVRNNLSSQLQKAMGDNLGKNNLFVYKINVYCGSEM